MDTWANLHVGPSIRSCSLVDVWPAAQLRSPGFSRDVAHARLHLSGQHETEKVIQGIDDAMRDEQVEAWICASKSGGVVATMIFPPLAQLTAERLHRLTIRLKALFPEGWTLDATLAAHHNVHYGKSSSCRPCWKPLIDAVMRHTIFITC